MRILPVNNKISFKGLWGEEVVKDKSYVKNFAASTQEHVHFEYTREYFPFLDETLSEVDNSIHEYVKKSYYSTNDHSYANGQPDSIHYNYEAKVMERLPIKIAEWNRYLKNKFSLSSLERNSIEWALRRLKLERYIK